MIVLIAPEKDIQNENLILNQLFEAGLDYFHLRKPDKNFEQHCNYLEQIDSKYHNRIVVHYFHELTRDFNLKGLHFQEQKRRKTTRETLETLLNKEGVSVSSSFHCPKELLKCPYNFDYHFLSPVFTSVSKKGYEGKGFDVNHIPKKIIGMGGATQDNINKFIHLGFQGVGVLGGIWNRENPIDVFKKMTRCF